MQRRRRLAGGGGPVTSFPVASDPASLDGLGLVVIFSNPKLPTTTIAVLDGGAEVDGDTATLSFAQPVDPGRPGFTAKLSLGSAHSYQGEAGAACGTFRPTAPRRPQSSTVDVNGARLSSCAGNYDDGVGSDGALITVGGVGDRLDNPTAPAQLPGDGATPRTSDDELYDLKPFAEEGHDAALDHDLERLEGRPRVPRGDLRDRRGRGLHRRGAAAARGWQELQRAVRPRHGDLPAARGEQVHARERGDAVPGRHGVRRDEGRGRDTSAGGRAGSKAAGEQTARFSAGRFVLVQKRVAGAVTALRLAGGDFKAACKVGKRGGATVPTKVVRRLLGDGKGRFRTRGRYSTATVRGTRWLTADRCDGTLTTVSQGEVEVLDLVKKKVRVMKGKKYFAKAHRSRGKQVRILRQPSSAKRGRTNSSNASRSQLATVAGVSARTEAVRGMSSASATSPKYSPGRRTRLGPSAPRLETAKMPERTT